MKRLLIFAATYNEAKNIGLFIEKILKLNTHEMKNELKDYIKNISINNLSPNDTTNII